MRFIVLTSMSAPNKLSSMYFKQLEDAGIPYHVYPNNHTSPNDGKLGACVTAWRMWAEKNSEYDRLIITDAWDVLCYGSWDRISEVLNDLPSYPIFAAERNCYPEPQLAELSILPRPWSFVNGGMLTSSPSDLIHWCNLIELHPDFEHGMLAQQWLNRQLAKHDPLVKIDWATRLFYCMFLEHLGNEMKNLNGKPYNGLYGTSPLLIHFNGAYDWNPFLEMMKNGK